MPKRKPLFLVCIVCASLLLIVGCTVDSNYNVMNAEEPRDIALDWLRNHTGSEAPPKNINWNGKDISPFGHAGSVTVEFTSGDWELIVSFSSDPPETREYQVEVTNQKAGRYWELKVLPDKTVEEMSTVDS
jgi:hypothetical protein